MRRLWLPALLAAVCTGCAGDENPVGPGTVTVTMTTSTTTTTTVAPTATAQFVFAPTAPAAQQAVFFNAFGSAPGRGTKIVTFAWEFGDGGTATGMSVSHTYVDQALYVVTLTVTDDMGDTAKVSQIVGAIAPPVTTTIPPASSAAQYVGNQTNPIIPSDLTLFFQLLTSASPLPEASDLAGPQAVDGDFTYTVTGTFRTPNGTTGTITGRLEGVVEPEPAGDFSGRLIANPPGCSATRNFSGPITAVSLQWTAGSMVRNTCATNPLAFTTLNLVQTNSPPVTTTSTTSSTTTTTAPTSTIPIAPLTAGTISAAPSGTGLAGATVYSFQYTTLPTGGVPPYSHSWNFGDGTAAGIGAAPTHVFPAGGTFTVIATVTDSQGMSAQASTSVVIGSVTGAWNVTYTSTAAGSVPTTYVDRVVLNQDQSQVTATVDHDACSSLGAGTGSVSNPRGLTVNVSVPCDGLVPVTYQGTLNDTLSTWSGIVIEGDFRAGCTKAAPCQFTATRTAALTGSRR
jgi:PKD domain